MSRALIVINSDLARVRARQLVLNCPLGTRVEFRQSKRTLPQNAKMWSMLGDIARQVKWPPGNGIKLRSDDWKLVFLDALPRETRVAPNLNLDGFVNLGRSSRDLTRQEMSDLIELMHAFGAQQGVTFHDSHDWQTMLDSTESDAIDRVSS